MMQITLYRFVAIGLFAVGTCLLSGCDDSSSGALRGVVEAVGAKMVARSSEGDLDPIGGERSNPFNVNTVNSDGQLPSLQPENPRQRSNPAGVQDNPYF